MRFFFFPLLSLSIATVLNGCAARVMTMPLEAATTVASAQTQPTGETPNAEFDPRDAGNVDDSSSAPVDPSFSSGSPTIDTPTNSYTIGTTAPAPAASPSPVPEPPAFLAEKPMAGNSGEVSFLIDAPDGSTATYSLDRNDPIDCGMSFGLDPVSPGNHTVEIIVHYPNGETITIEHDWFQAAPTPSPTPTSGKKDRRDRGKNRGKSEDHRRDGRHGRGHDDDRDHDRGHDKNGDPGKDDGHGKDQTDSHGKSDKK